MNISSRATYLVPFALLLLTSVLTVYGDFWSTLSAIFFSLAPGYFLTSLIFSIALAFIFYFILRKLFATYVNSLAKYILLLVPTCIEILICLFSNRMFQFRISLLFAGIILIVAFVTLTKRYMAVLSDTSINFINLLGQSGTIPLVKITKLEQKKNVLSFIQGLDFLEVSKKIEVTFLNDSLDEFEINIYGRAFKNDDIFDMIITNANLCGNYKIRQYTT